MKFGKRLLCWTPGAVSWLSLLIMGAVVAAVGLMGTRLVIEYLQQRMAQHYMDHNREIAQRIQPLISAQLAGDTVREFDKAAQSVDFYGSFGYRIFLVSGQGDLLLDSGADGALPGPLGEGWLDDLEWSRREAPAGGGEASATNEAGHPQVIWLERLQGPDSDGNVYLGVASDQHQLNDFLSDLHLQLDAILLTTYAMIGLIGVFAMRGIGRAYERRLEYLLERRSGELEAAHREVLAKTRLATIGQTASVLAHEMRNPLASIKLALSGMGSRESLAKREQRRVDLVIGEVDRLDTLLSQTLDYARPIQLSNRPVSVDKLLTNVIAQQQPLLDRRGLKIRREECGECLVARMDEAKMHQALLNVLKNALEASPDGTRILVSLKARGDELELLVANGGEPPSRETLDHAFDLFYSTKPKGSGLGLGLVKRIIEEHGGRVSLSWDRALGTCVTIQLPRSSE